MPTEPPAHAPARAATPSATPSEATVPRSIYDGVAVFFVAFLLLSTIAATKLIGLGIGPLHLVFDGGAILFPLTYILGDVLSEVYGFARARRVILFGFAAQALASLIFWIVDISPGDPTWENQEAFSAVLGVVPRFAAASLIGYLAGQLLNSYVLVKMKERFGTAHLWTRLLGSTLVGELADTALFCTIAWIGAAPLATIANLTITGYIYKVGVEAVLLPLTYTVVRWVRRREGIDTPSTQEDGQAGASEE